MAVGTTGRIGRAASNRNPRVKPPSRRNTVTKSKAVLSVKARRPCGVKAEIAEKPKLNGTNYSVETYMEVTRWTADTAIEYGPNPKNPKSKSFVRYNQYMKCKTIGEVLKYCVPPDLLWDFERGFYKVTGGPIRDEPVDLRRAAGEGAELTPTDLLLGRWVTKELCKRSGMSAQQAASESSMFNETSCGHMLKTMADRSAADILARAHAECRRITDEEVLQVLKSWPFKQNTGRLNVMPEGQRFVFSDTAGLNVGRDGDVHATRHTAGYPSAVALLCQWMQERLPLGCALPFTSINMNYGYGAVIHRDQNNDGYSTIAAFGDFTGGNLRYWAEDDRSVSREQLRQLREFPPSDLDLKANLALFDGHRAHEVAPFEGKRYTLVWFAVSKCHKASQETLDALEHIGFNIPSPGKMEAMRPLLPPPRGYSSHDRGQVRNAAPPVKASPRGGKAAQDGKTGQTGFAVFGRTSGPRTAAQNAEAGKVLRNIQKGLLQRVGAKVSRGGS